MERLIQSAAELGAAVFAEQMGLTAGELSQRAARKTYGAYFDTLVRDGRIAPVRIEAGRAGTKFYRVADILACKVQDRAKAQLINP